LKALEIEEFLHDLKEFFHDLKVFSHDLRANFHDLRFHFHNLRSEFHDLSSLSPVASLTRNSPPAGRHTSGEDRRPLPPMKQAIFSFQRTALRIRVGDS